MMRALASIATGLLLGAAAAPPPTITGLKTIPLHGGVNRVPGFLPDGGMATIVQGWVGNGNAHGHYTWMVLGSRSEGQPAGIVVFGDGGGGDTISASPFDGERVTGDVRFATGRMQGRVVSLAIKGVLEWSPSGVIADHAIATIHWYKLVDYPDGIGPTQGFIEIGSLQTTRRYCNVDLAMRDAAGLALPSDFAGANRVDGCFPNQK